MRRIGAMMLAAAFGLPALAQDPPKLVPLRSVQKSVPIEKESDDKKPAEGSAEEQLAKAKKEYEKALRTYTEKRQEASALAKEIYEKDPKADAALAAVEIMSQTGGMIGTASTKIYAEVAKNHFANPKIKPLMAMLARGAAGEGFLEKVLESNKDKSVQAQACYMIAEATLALVDREKDKAKSDALAEKALTYFERAKNEFGDVVYQGDKMVNVAEGAMFSLKYLRPGKPVPEIEGPDMDGKTFKISDYKGKVVMIDFWGHW